jgi:hypothetical protein
MRKTILLLVAGCLVLVGSCKNQGAAKPQKMEPSQPQVQEQAKSEAFPQIMVGVWEAKVDDQSKWGFKFESDGSLKKIIHSVAGPVNLESGGVYGEADNDPNSYMMFQMGPCKADYDAAAKILNVSIAVDYYRMQLPTGVIEGKIKDEFTGPVSEDGKTWKVKWWDYSWLEGAEPPDPNLVKANPFELTFYKLDIKSDANSPNQYE